MDGKKKYIAIVLFLLLGLTIFTFANPSGDNNTLSGNTGNNQETVNNTTPSDKPNEDEDDTHNKNDHVNNNKNENDFDMGVGGVGDPSDEDIEIDQTFAIALTAVKIAEKIC